MPRTIGRVAGARAVVAFWIGTKWRTADSRGARRDGDIKQTAAGILNFGEE